MHMHTCTIGMICSQQDQESKWLLCMFSENVTQLFSPDVMYVFCSNYADITLSKCSNNFSFYWISHVLVSFLSSNYESSNVFLECRLYFSYTKHVLQSRNYDYFSTSFSDTLCTSCYSSNFYILWHCNINDKCRKAKHLQKQISRWTVFRCTAI